MRECSLLSTSCESLLVVGSSLPPPKGISSRPNKINGTCEPRPSFPTLSIYLLAISGRTTQLCSNFVMVRNFAPRVTNAHAVSKITRIRAGLRNNRCITTNSEIRAPLSGVAEVFRSLIQMCRYELPNSPRGFFYGELMGNITLTALKKNGNNALDL